ncbi:hypothetical protein AYI70_g3094 [Smittium culicis]|uniref:Uncharacterized protein n=1 Tax=Smittium culicis TaxID=133412 RepID=A0A1R1Y515_9FUNG|nr:hypothetical protein AYI70_g3094 [Smittium culicis]
MSVSRRIPPPVHYVWRLPSSSYIAVGSASSEVTPKSAISGAVCTYTISFFFLDGLWNPFSTKLRIQWLSEILAHEERNVARCLPTGGVMFQ